MKKFLLLILSFVLGLFAFVGCGETTEDSYEEVETVEYDITYFVVFDAESPTVLSDTYKVQGSTYPITYEKGVGATIPALKAAVTVSEVDYTFKGWYVDAACSTVLANNTLSTENIGDVKLYAKYASENDAPIGPVEPVVHDIKYFVTVNGAGAIAMTDEYKAQGETYPITYEYGKGAIIPDAKAEVATADGVVVFKGWFENQDCTVTFDGISATNTGDVTLYAKYATVYYNLTYKAVLGTEAAVDFSDTYKAQNATYAATYEYGKVAEISNAKTEVSVGGKTYQFKGWYFDETCTTAANFTATTSGDKTVYAKYTEKVIVDDDDRNWTQNY